MEQKPKEQIRWKRLKRVAKKISGQENRASFSIEKQKQLLKAFAEEFGNYS